MKRHETPNPLALLRALALLVAALLAVLPLAGCAAPRVQDSPLWGAATQGQTAEGGSSEAQGSTGAQDSANSAQQGQPAATDEHGAPSVDEGGTYTAPEDVAAYLHVYGHLPSNYISKTKARKAGWDASAGNLQDVCPGKSIGGGPFYNDDGLLPDADGRTWKECDVNYHGGHRGSERLCYSNDGLIYYTADHYRTFERLY